MHQPKAHIEGLSIKRENSGRGLIKLELTNKTTTSGLKKYYETPPDWMLQLVKTPKKQKKNIQFVKKSINFLNNSTSHRKGIDMKDRSIETTKTKEAKPQRHNIKHKGEKLLRTIPTKN